MGSGIISLIEFSPYTQMTKEHIAGAAWPSVNAYTILPLFSRVVRLSPGLHPGPGDPDRVVLSGFSNPLDPESDHATEY
ncbi:hypothetical protein DFR30_1256 [Thiogranum longum]|uniref:Uncharacterized protein n=1 Tax=Thiogranum longum TaxID=1537524 RepID=A0A4R1H835_9GAMM|nr:hypothetical protein DFR30_1256 [Thiogranum longum]